MDCAQKNATQHSTYFHTHTHTNYRLCRPHRGKRKYISEKQIVWTKNVQEGWRLTPAMRPRLHSRSNIAFNQRPNLPHHNFIHTYEATLSQSHARLAFAVSGGFHSRNTNSAHRTMIFIYILVYYAHDVYSREAIRVCVPCYRWCATKTIKRAFVCASNPTI